MYPFRTNRKAYADGPPAVDDLEAPRGDNGPWSVIRLRQDDDVADGQPDDRADLGSLFDGVDTASMGRPS